MKGLDSKAILEPSNHKGRTYTPFLDKTTLFPWLTIWPTESRGCDIRTSITSWPISQALAVNVPSLGGKLEAMVPSAPVQLCVPYQLFRDSCGAGPRVYDEVNSYPTREFAFARGGAALARKSFRRCSLHLSRFSCWPLLLAELKVARSCCDLPSAAAPRSQHPLLLEGTSKPSLTKTLHLILEHALGQRKHWHLSTHLQG